MPGLEIPLGRDAELVEARRAEGTFVPFLEVHPDLQIGLDRNYDKTGAGLRINYPNLSTAASEIGLEDPVILELGLGLKKTGNVIELDNEGIGSKVCIDVNPETIEYPDTVDTINKTAYLGLMAVKTGLSKESQARRQARSKESQARRGELYRKAQRLENAAAATVPTSVLSLVAFLPCSIVFLVEGDGMAGAVALGSAVSLITSYVLGVRAVSIKNKAANYLTAVASIEDTYNQSQAQRLALESPVLERTFTALPR